MLWATLAIISGFFDSLGFTVIKKLNKLDIYSKLLFLNLTTLPFIFIFSLFYEIPKVSSEFYVVILINTLVFLSAQFLMVKSLQISDMSLAVPMLSFTPVFLLLSSYLLLKELPTFLGLIGIAVIVIGSYILNITSINQGYLEPIKSIFKNRGVFYMMGVAFLFSITGNLAKIGIKLSNPGYFMVMQYFLTSLILIVIFFKKLKNLKNDFLSNTKMILALGIVSSASESLIAISLTSSIVPYIISLKRTSIIFSVLLGFFLFKEKNFKEKVVGAVLMFAGAALIILSQ
ncbi:EamA family transporter [Candidatus Woesearchaeota archaeon]|nr:EamA family transporter [Candidatus Woesearchaeota archaeon]